MTLSIGSNENYGPRSRYQTFGCIILENFDFPCQLEATAIVDCMIFEIRVGVIPAVERVIQKGPFLL